MKNNYKEPMENDPKNSRRISQAHEPATETIDPELLERALASSAEGITISDARLPDNPIVYANEGFERLTGYSREDILGRNCRFLQGRDTEPDAVSAIRKGIDDGRTTTVELLNYKKDGTPFWNRLSITPVKNPSQRITHYIGVQSDLTERKEIEVQLRRTTQKLEDAYGELKKDVEAAARIQRALLPSSLPQLEEVRFAWDFRPSADLAGDFLNIIPLSDHQLGIYILDVSGHGVAASLLSVTLSRWLSANPYQSFLLSQGADGSRPGVTPPSEVAARLNQQLISDTTNESVLHAHLRCARPQNVRVPACLRRPLRSPTLTARRWHRAFRLERKSRRTVGRRSVRGAHFAAEPGRPLVLLHGWFDRGRKPLPIRVR